MPFCVSQPTLTSSQSSSYTENTAHPLQNPLFVLTVNRLRPAFHLTLPLQSGSEKPPRNSPLQKSKSCSPISERHTHPQHSVGMTRTPPSPLCRRKSAS